MVRHAGAQGTFVYDQQSSTDETPNPLPAQPVIQQSTPFGQSFTPAFSAVGFVRMKLYDTNPNNGLGATLFVNLRTDSITGPVLGMTAPVTLADGFENVVNFFFPAPVSVASGTLYYFEAVVQTGDLWKADTRPYNYPGGTLISLGLPISGSDLWFREGVLVPEPSTALLVLAGAGVFVYVRRSHIKRRSAA